MRPSWVTKWAISQMIRILVTQTHREDTQRRSMLRQAKRDAATHQGVLTATKGGSGKGQFPF